MITLGSHGKARVKRSLIHPPRVTALYRFDSILAVTFMTDMKRRTTVTR